MGASVRLGKILGIPIEINVSWVFVFLLFTYLLAEQFGRDNPQWPAAQQWSIAAITAILFFASVLAHELSHCVVAIRKGIPVKGITLFIFGGVSQLAHEARRPFTEFIVAVVGPLSSVLLGGVFAALWFLADGFSSTLQAVFFLLATINVSLGVFNMLPGFPLDGGRVLRAAVWGLTGSYWRATQVAARAGQGLGALMVIGGILLAVFLTGIGSIWMALIGAFLFTAATASYRQERTREGLRTHRVADMMATNWWTLPGDTSIGAPLVAQVVTGRALGPQNDFLVVSDQGQAVGLVTRRTLSQLRGRGWGMDVPVDVPMSRVMIPLASIPQLTPESSISDALELLEGSDLIDHLAVLQNGALVGIINRQEVFRLAYARGRGRSRD